MVLLLFHIIVALTGLFYTAYVFFYPSKQRLNIVYALLALTITSGSYLIWTSRAHILQTCTEGLVYVGVMLVGIFATRRKLAVQS